MEQRDKITLDGITLEYEVETNNEFSDFTYFYYGTEKIKKKKYGFFGPEVFIEKPRIIFFIEENIKEPKDYRSFVYYEPDTFPNLFGS